MCWETWRPNIRDMVTAPPPKPQTLWQQENRGDSDQVRLCNPGGQPAAGARSAAESTLEVELQVLTENTCVQGAGFRTHERAMQLQSTFWFNTSENWNWKLGPRAVSGQRREPLVDLGGLRRMRWVGRASASLLKWRDHCSPGSSQ